MKALYSIYSVLTVVLCLTSCGGVGNGEKAQVLETDSVQEEQLATKKDVDIPRAHLGVTLGMSWDEAKPLLLSNVCKGLNEDVDTSHKGILVEDRGDWLGDWGTKYSKFYIEIFDGKIFSISLEPRNNASEVIEAIKQKYPFEVEEKEELRYHGKGLVTKQTKKNYSCSNGETEIYLDDYSYFIRYRDMKLKVAKSNYLNEVENLSKQQQEDDVASQLSDY